MELVFYPGCNFIRVFPAAAQASIEYMQKRHNATIGNCCRDESTKARPGQRAAFVCNTCATFIDEWADADELVSIYVTIDQDEDFSFPNYEGKRMAIQDCWRASDRPELHDAFRSLAAKMNIDLVELEENRENSLFCGTSTMHSMPERYLKYAPKKFGGPLPEGFFVERSPEERDASMKAHAAKIPVDDVICNCHGCAPGLAAGGKNSVHILELVFATV